jgi:hypothetical protein
MNWGMSSNRPEIPLRGIRRILENALDVLQDNLLAKKETRI